MVYRLTSLGHQHWVCTSLGRSAPLPRYGVKKVKYDERPQRSAYAMCGARPKCDLVLERLPDGRTEPDDARMYFSCYVEKYIGRDRERVKGGMVVFFSFERFLYFEMESEMPSIDPVRSPIDPVTSTPRDHACFSTSRSSSERLGRTTLLVRGGRSSDCAGGDR